MIRTSSKPKPNVEAVGGIDEYTWPQIVAAIILAVSLPLLVIELLDTGIGFAVPIKVDSLRGKILNVLNLSPALLFALIAASLGRLGRQAAFLSTFGLFLAMFVVFNFRGDNIREGTFDFYETSRWGWLKPIVLGHITGVVAGLLSLRLLPVKLPSRRLAWGLAVALLVASGNAYRMVAVSPRSDWSSFAPTRPYALLFLGVVALIALAVSREDAHE